MCFGGKRNAGIIQYSTKSMVVFFFLENELKNKYYDRYYDILHR